MSQKDAKDKIILKGLSFYGFHGLLRSERETGQPFYIDLEITTNLRKVGKSDCIRDTINYALVYEIIQKIVEGKSFHLIEALGECIAQTLLEAFSDIHELCLCVKKPYASIQGLKDYFAIEITRSRNKRKSKSSTHKAQESTGEI